GNARRRLIELKLAEQPMRAESLAMIAGVDNPRVAGEPKTLQRGQHNSDLLIQMAAKRVVASCNPVQQLLIVQILVGEVLAQMANSRMLRPITRPVGCG